MSYTMNRGRTLGAISGAVSMSRHVVHPPVLRRIPTILRRGIRPWGCLRLDRRPALHLAGACDLAYSFLTALLRGQRRRRDPWLLRRPTLMCSGIGDLPYSVLSARLVRRHRRHGRRPTLGVGDLPHSVRPVLLRRQRGQRRSGLYWRGRPVLQGSRSELACLFVAILYCNFVDIHLLFDHCLHLLLLHDQHELINGGHQLWAGVHRDLRAREQVLAGLVVALQGLAAELLEEEFGPVEFLGLAAHLRIQLRLLRRDLLGLDSLLLLEHIVLLIGGDAAQLLPTLEPPDRVDSAHAGEHQCGADQRSADQCQGHAFILRGSWRRCRRGRGCARGGHREVWSVNVEGRV
mmetsp:Transcript_47302/g.150687  ORF Transcript_47302/g.150687 Transcript_47302/m.150687 type:complete len:348 (-) Transcript_47302:3196-4239(-)